MTVGAALFMGNCSGHGVGSGSSHHPGLGGGTLSPCPHSPTVASIVPKDVNAMDAVTTWKPHGQKPLTAIVRTVIINNKIPIIDQDELITHPTQTKHSTTSVGYKCYNTQSSPAWHCTIGTSGGREAAVGHARKLFATSKTVFIEGKPAGRIGDPLGDKTTAYPCNSVVSGGSKDVYIGL